MAVTLGCCVARQPSRSCHPAAPVYGATLSPQDAAAAGAKLVVLPEMWNCPYSNDSFPTYAEDIDGGASPSAAAMAAAAAEARVVLVGGSIPEQSEVGWRRVRGRRAARAKSSRWEGLRTFTHCHVEKHGRRLHLGAAGEWRKGELGPTAGRREQVGGSR